MYNEAIVEQLVQLKTANEPEKVTLTEEIIATVFMDWAASTYLVNNLDNDLYQVKFDDFMHRLRAISQDSLDEINEDLSEDQ